jgi:5,10-methylenetetrahydromethanopterin reductase
MTGPAGRDLRFSLRLNNDLPVARFAALAAAAEDAGFDQVWISHDLFWRSAPVLVAAAAAATGRIGLGIGVMNPYSEHPAELAMHAATLQELSAGRFLLGLGAGAREFLAWAGIDRPRPLAVTREAVLACRTLLSRGRPAVGGGAPEPPDDQRGWQPAAHLRFEGPPVPVYLAAMGPRMLTLAGEIADGVLGLSFPPERAPAAAALVRRGAEAVGRDPVAIDVPACFWCSIDDDPERAARPLAEKLAYYGPSISAVQLADAGLSPADFVPAAAAMEAGDPAAARRLIADRMLRLGIAGDAAAVLARCRGLVASGATHLSFGPPLGPDPVGAVGLLGRDVLPALRG